MSQQVLTGQARVDRAATTLARLLEAPPSPDVLAVLPDLSWPMHDAEALRGVALLAESRLAGEHPDRLRLDHARLFVGAVAGPAGHAYGRAPVGHAGVRPPVAAAGVPSAAAPALDRLLDQVAAAGLLPAGRTGDVPGTLRAYAALTHAPREHPHAARWRAELLSEHLLTWGAQCLTRVQLGAQTFCYQGVAILGLGLLRHAEA